MSLNSYRKKRNFKNTPEPQGNDRTPPQRGALRFVVQLHDATRKHYDLRLELEGTMKSWAVPKGPSLDPLERRLAVQVEDHPIEYNDFEGIIPPGNYGAGVVMIWDEGTYTARAIEFPAKDETDALRRGLANGHLTVILEGTKLRGEFALIRLAKGGANNWLLVKKHDRFVSRDEITHSDRSARSGRTLGEIAASAHQEGRIWISTKHDRSQVKKTGRPKSAPAPRKTLAPRFRKRAKAEDLPMPSRPVPWLPVVEAPSGAGIIHQPLFDGYRAQLAIDADGNIHLGGKSGAIMTRRFPNLITTLGSLRGPLCLDGLVVALDGSRRPRRRGQGLKVGKSAYAFYVYDLLHVDGFGLSELPLTDRLAVLDQLALANDAVVIVEHAKSTIPQSGDAIGGLARPSEDPYSAKTAHIYHFGHAHRGRQITETAEKATLITASDPATESRGSASHHSVVAQTTARHASARLALKNLTKVYWPDERLTKGDLIDYYQIAAPLMVPHLANRPQSLHRHPNGIKGQSFFQKEVAGHVPGWMQTATIASGRSGKVVTYALIQTETDLLYLANMGCIEINTWLSRVPAVNQPDFVVFDLDPGTISFAAVIETAHTVKHLLDEIGAPSYCKTSGGRGLHVYVPIKGASCFDEARVFAEVLSREVHRLLPTTTSLERSPDKRRSLIYLDYLQNRIGQTMAAIYSARPRPQAPVSTPLKWSEVKPGLDPSAFTIKTVPKRLKRLGDLWQGILDEAVPLAACQKALEALLSGRTQKDSKK